MSFRRMSGIRLPYRRQGLIYFTLLSYEDMGKKGKKRIDAKLLEAAYGEEAFAAALRDDGAGGGDRARRQREHALPSAQAAV